MKIIEKEFNAATGEETITQRDETTAETKVRLDYENARAAILTEAEAKTAQKAAVFTKLGLTADEVAALLG